MSCNCNNITNLNTAPNPCAGSIPCTQIIDAACVKVNGVLPCVPGINPSVTASLAAICSNVTQSGTLEAKVSLTSAQIHTLHTSPVIAIPAPGPGHFVKVLQAYIVYTYGTTPYVTGLERSLYLSTVVNGLSFAWAPDFLDQTTSSVITGLNSEGYQPGIVLDNQPLYVGLDRADPTGASGDGTMVIYITYKIVAI